MAVARFTAFSDTTEQTVLATPCKVTSVVVKANKAQSGAAYIQLFDATNPTPGTTKPEVSFRVNTLAID